MCAPTYNARFHALIEEFGRITGVPVVLNTSFNNDNEPIVDSIDDAITCFLTTDIQYLFIGDWMVCKPASIREHSGLVDLVPTIPKSYKLVRRAEPKGTGIDSHSNARRSALYAKPVPISRDLALILMLAEPAESVRATYTRLQSSLGSIEALGQELFAIWQMRALRLLPPPKHITELLRPPRCKGDQTSSPQIKQFFADSGLRRTIVAAAIAANSNRLSTLLQQ